MGARSIACGSRSEVAGYYTHPLSQILDLPYERASALGFTRRSACQRQPLSVFRAGRSAPPARSGGCADRSTAHRHAVLVAVLDDAEAVRFVEASRAAFPRSTLRLDAP